jgi:hypothetical protein
MFRHQQNSILILQGVKKKEAGVLNRECSKDKEEQIQNASFCSKSWLGSSRTLEDLVSGILEKTANHSDMCRHYRQ